MQLATQISLQGRTIPVTVRRHRRARRITIRFSAAHDALLMTLPMRSSLESGMKFLQSRTDWVLESLREDSSVTLTDEAVIPVLGHEYTIHNIKGRGVTQLATDNQQLLVYGDPAFTPRRVRDFLKKHLQCIITERANALATRMGKKIRAVSVREMRSRWGSCNARGNLAFSWRLVFAPEHVLDYLIAHETAHLLELSHGPRFWEIVARYCPHHKTSRDWLKKHGHELHRYK